MTIDQLQATVGQFISEQAASNADVSIERSQRCPLQLRVVTEIEFVRHQVSDTNPAVSLDAVANGGGHGRLLLVVNQSVASSSRFPTNSVAVATLACSWT